MAEAGQDEEDNNGINGYEGKDWNIYEKQDQNELRFQSFLCKSSLMVLDGCRSNQVQTLAKLFLLFEF